MTGSFIPVVLVNIEVIFLHFWYDDDDISSEEKMKDVGLGIKT